MPLEQAYSSKCPVVFRSNMDLPADNLVWVLGADSQIGGEAEAKK